MESSALRYPAGQPAGGERMEDFLLELEAISGLFLIVEARLEKEAECGQSGGGRTTD